MLVLSRKLNQEIMIGENVKITVLKVKGNTVRLGIEAPRSVRVVRGELPPVETPMAEVTVVFDNGEVESRVDQPADVVPFRKPVEKKPSEPRHLENRMSDLGDSRQSAPSSINFRQALPETFQRNRLRQIVDEISSRTE